MPDDFEEPEHRDISRCLAGGRTACQLAVRTIGSEPVTIAFHIQLRLQRDLFTRGGRLAPIDVFVDAVPREALHREDGEGPGLGRTAARRERGQNEQKERS